ncbi:hypothetical protein PSHT_10377 [Puccinia striiformis]|uniref:Uncharacterized protein n=1 Tax=Puccinia striiformis TaxID=27350 RepID=A0A2S4VA97_9BASI|nr:hypothetical protein PSHT_10377 [Puccinia striiformis]
MERNVTVDLVIEGFRKLMKKCNSHGHFTLRGLHDHLTQALLRAINIVCCESDFLIQQLILSTDMKDGDSHVALSRKCLLSRESPLMTLIERIRTLGGDGGSEVTSAAARPPEGWDGLVGLVPEPARSKKLKKMSDSNPTDSDPGALDPSSTEEQDIGEQAGKYLSIHDVSACSECSIARELSFLELKCASERLDRAQDHTPPVSDQIVGPLNAKRNLVVQIQSSHLPRLRQLIATLLKQHYPFELPGTSFENYWLRSETYSELEGALENIYASSQTLCPTPAKSSSIRTNDKDLEEIKFYRLHGLASHLDGEFTTRIVAMMFTCSRLLEPMFVTTDPTERFREEVSRCFESIEDSQDWLNDSELRIVQCEWPNEKDKINERLEVVLINRLNLSTHTNDGEPDLSPLRECVLQKASRSSHRIDSAICWFIQPELTLIQTQWGKFQCSINLHEELIYGKQLKEALQTLKTDFQAGLNVIILCCVPIIPDTHTQNYYRDWLATWNTLLSLAISNLLNACGIFFEPNLKVWMQLVVASALLSMF